MFAKEDYKTRLTYEYDLRGNLISVKEAATAGVGIVVCGADMLHKEKWTL